MNFYFSRGIFPFYSALWGSRYSAILRNLIEKYSTKNIIFVDIALLKDETIRSNFCQNFLQTSSKTEPVFEKLVGKNIKFEEEKPDFSSKELDFLRSFFRYDLENFQSQLKQFDLNTEFLDFKHLNHQII